MKQNSLPVTSIARGKKDLQGVLEILEPRAYLSGVVFGSPQNLSAAAAGLAPVYANLDNISSPTHADLIIANAASGSVPNSLSVLPGNGDGTFGTARTIPLTFSPLTILDGQLGTNGKTDIVVGSHNNSTVGVILQASDGTLSEHDYTATGLVDTQSVAIGNFGNGLQDIAVASDDPGASNNVAIFFNNGDGTFTLHQVLSVPHTHLASLTSFTALGVTDLAVADQDDNEVTVLINNGIGTFASGTSYAVGAGPVTIKSGTFDRSQNANDDLVTANSSGGSVSVLLGNGDGTFNSTAITTALAGVPAGGGPLKVRVANLTNSGNPDLIALLSPGSSGNAEVLLGQGNGTFHVGNVITVAGSPTALAAGDLNGDGLTDMALAGPSQVSAFLNITNQDTTAPTAAVDVAQPAQTAGSATITFTVTYTDAHQIDTTTLNGNNVTVTGPAGQNEPVTLVSTNLANAASVTATYSIPATSNSLSAADNGTYHVTATSNASQAVTNANNVPVAGGAIGAFTVTLLSAGPNLVASMTTKMPASVVAGTHSSGRATVTVTNAGTQLAKGTIVINVYASTTPSIPGGAPLLLTLTKKVNLKPGKHVSFGLPRFTWPANLNGGYFLVANVNATQAIAETNYADNVAASATAVTVAPPFVDLANLWNGTLPRVLTAAKKVSIPVLLKNNGNVAAKGTATITIQASVSGTSVGATTLGTATPKVNVGAGKKQTARATFTMPTLAAGTYHILVTVSFPGDTDAGDKTVVSTATFTV